MTWNELLITIVQSLVSILILGGLPILFNYFKSKTKNESMILSLDTAERAISIVVSKVSQTFVDDLKKNGQFDKASQQEAFKMAYDEILDMLDDEAKGYITKLYGNFEKWLTDRIEAQIQQNKK